MIVGDIQSLETSNMAAATANAETHMFPDHTSAGVAPTVGGNKMGSLNGKVPSSIYGYSRQSFKTNNQPAAESTVPDGFQDETEILCGPLLNYKGMTHAGTEASIWRGSVLIVTKLGHRMPEIRVDYKGLWNREHEMSSDKEFTSRQSVSKASTTSTIKGVKLYQDPGKTFWRFAIDLPLQAQEARWVYSITSRHFYPDSKHRSSPNYTIIVPSYLQSMRIMFHSCNGFSVGTDEEAWSGPAVWNDVLRRHDETPFHVMIGGGDQIYNDAVRVTGPLKGWTDISNPVRRREYPFDETLMAACDSFYFENYAKWYSTEPFASANSQIPQINIWDDHGKLGYR